ncbi:L,D-transpeptidase [Ahrensia kielensis]|uniref:L,D-transpeptidase n=1 Tax=Ahrensia kielensis TaxID=76980 RepID=A0ABU9T4S2_9HYPH|nr:L,D-transpeptidase [Ahrensia kielensis]
MGKLLGAITLSIAIVLSGVSTSLAAKLVAYVDISSQTMTVKKNGKTMHRWKVSTGRKGYRTPHGTYSPKRMHKMWYSRKYDNSPMPYSIFFRGGYAIHGTNYVSRLGRVASHGCVRLKTANAKRLYDLTRQVGARNMRVVIKH